MRVEGSGFRSKVEGSKLRFRVQSSGLRVRAMIRAQGSEGCQCWQRGGECIWRTTTKRLDHSAPNCTKVPVPPRSVLNHPASRFSTMTSQTPDQKAETKAECPNTSRAMCLIGLRGIEQQDTAFLWIDDTVPLQSAGQPFLRDLPTSDALNLVLRNAWRLGLNDHRTCLPL